jgi:DNA-binding SARP family transcriptional activator
VLVDVRLLGGFTLVIDGAPVPATRWVRRHSSALVKLLALSPGGRLHRDRVVDALWPDLTLDVALPRLHKAAHYARRALGDRDAIVLKGGIVAFFPGATLEVDVAAFEAAADSALSTEPVSPESCAKALQLSGELLPEDLGEPWLDEPRVRVRARVERLLHGAHRWDDLLRIDPANEAAHVEVLREAVLGGDRTQALRRYARMEQALRSELGITPGAEAVALRERLLAADAAPSQPSTVDGPREAVAEQRTALVERKAELRTLETAIRSAVAEGRGVVVLISGDAGTGKSALVQAFLQQLSPEVLAVVGGCDDLLAPRSLGPFRDMAAVNSALAAVLAGDQLDDVLPGLLHFLANQSTVVVVEDVHWADDATLDAIRYLSRRIPGLPAVLVLTMRETGLDAEHPLRQILGGLAGPSVRRLTLQPLSVAAVQRLGGVSVSAAAEIHRATQGNPFFVTEVLVAGGAGVPETVRDAVLARLGRLAPTARTLVQRLSVVPTRADRWLAEALAGGEPIALVEAERSGMVIGGPTAVSFRHELARQAIEASLVPEERLQANRAVVNILLQHGEVEVARLVHHAERCGQVEVILQHGPTAAMEAARLGAHRQAADVLRIVLDHRHLLGAREVADLCTRRAYSLYVVNQYEAALQSATAGVVAAEEASDDSLLAAALLVLARVALFARGPMRAREAAERAVMVLDPAGDDARRAAALTELARAHSNLATVGIVAQPSDRAEALARQAVMIGQRLRRDDILAQAFCYLGDARLARGDPRGADDLERAISLARADSRAETGVRCFVNAAGGAYRSGRLAEAERYVSEGLRVAADGEFFAGQYRLRLTAAAVRASRGDWVAAIADLRALLSGQGEPGVMAALARSMLARLLARRGDPGADDILATALADPGIVDDGFVLGPLAVARAELGWLDGSLGAMTDEIKHGFDLTAQSGHTSLHAELCAYLRRAEIEIPGPADPPGPWAPTLAGRWEEAAATWGALGERYEQAVVLATAPNTRAQARGLRMLRDLGAVATLPAV